MGSKHGSAFLYVSLSLAFLFFLVSSYIVNCVLDGLILAAFPRFFIKIDSILVSEMASTVRNNNRLQLETRGS